jgi:hypothetical protein
VNPADGHSIAAREFYGSPGDRAVPRGARPNPGAPTTGQAGLRNNPPVHGPGGGGGDGGWYPYYPYYGWGYGYGYYGYYDPFYWWWWGSPLVVVHDGGYYGNEPIGRGGLKLRVEPTNAEVFVDGYYMGIVDDFDGTFQKMDLEVGAHHVEIRAPGYQTIAIDVRIEFAETVTYRGAMQPLSKK